MKSEAVYLDRTQVSYLLALAQSARVRTGSPMALELVALLRAELARRTASIAAQARYLERLVNGEEAKP